MKQSVNFDDFATAFKNIRPDNFSYDGLRVLFDYLENLEEDIGEQIDLDVVALCCEYSEESLSEVVDNYSINLEDCKDEKDERETILHVLRENACFAQLVDDNTIIYQQF